MAGTYAKEFSVSGMMGVAVGVATRRLSSDALYGAGLCCIGLQCLSYLGFITIHWSAVESAVAKAADQNGDGKLDMDDVKIMLSRFLKFVSRGMPDVAGFSAGFFTGFKLLG